MCDLFKSRGFTMASSSSFKKFLEHKLFLEMAIPGDIVKYPFQFEEDDIDFWNQFPVEYRPDAVHKRYNLLYEKIEKLEELRKKAGIKDLIERTINALKDPNIDVGGPLEAAWKYLSNWTPNDNVIRKLDRREIENLRLRRANENFKPLFATSSQIAKIAQNFAYSHFKKYEKPYLLEVFGEDGSADSEDKVGDFSLKYLDPKQKGKKQYSKTAIFKNIKLNLLRLYERLEKTEGELHSEKFQPILGERAKYGFDLSSPAIIEKESQKDSTKKRKHKVTNGMVFPNLDQIRRRLRSYFTNIEQRLFLPENVTEADLNDPKKYKWVPINMESTYVEQWKEEKRKEINVESKDINGQYGDFHYKKWKGKTLGERSEAIEKRILKELEEGILMILGQPIPTLVVSTDAQGNKIKKIRFIPRKYDKKRKFQIYVPVPVQNGEPKMKTITIIKHTPGRKDQKRPDKKEYESLTIPEIVSSPAFSYETSLKQGPDGKAVVQYRRLTPQEYVEKVEKGDISKDKEDEVFSLKNTGALHTTSNLEGARFTSPADEKFDERMAKVFPGLFGYPEVSDEEKYDGIGCAYFTENLATGPVSQAEEEPDEQSPDALDRSMTKVDYTKLPKLKVIKQKFPTEDSAFFVTGLYSILEGIKRCFYGCKGNTHENLVPFTQKEEYMEEMYKEIEKKFMLSLRDPRLQTVDGKIQRAMTLSHNIFQRLEVPRKKRLIGVFWNELMAAALAGERGSEYIASITKNKEPEELFEIFKDLLVQEASAYDPANPDFEEQLKEFVDQFDLYDESGKIFNPKIFLTKFKNIITKCKTTKIISEDVYETIQYANFWDMSEEDFQKSWDTYRESANIPLTKPSGAKTSKKKDKPETTTATAIPNASDLIIKSLSEFSNDQDWLNQFLFKKGTLNLFESIDMPSFKRIISSYTITDLQKKVMLDVYQSRNPKILENVLNIYVFLSSIKSNKNKIYQNNSDWSFWADKKDKEFKEKLFDVLDNSNFQSPDDLEKSLKVHANESKYQILGSSFLEKLEEKIETKLNQLFPEMMRPAERRDQIEDLERNPARLSPLLQKFIKEQEQKMNQIPTTPQQISGTPIQREWRRRFFR